MLRYFSSAGYIVNKTRSLLDQTCSCVCGIGAARWHWSSNRYMSITLNWLVILLSSLNSTTYVLLF